jgi:peptide methionine sulfoxide reductase MsrA
MMEIITLGGGCFWCTEAVFEQVLGVVAVESGYCNGHVVAPLATMRWFGCGSIPKKSA